MLKILDIQASKQYEALKKAEAAKRKADDSKTASDYEFAANLYYELDSENNHDLTIAELYEKAAYIYSKEEISQKREASKEDKKSKNSEKCNIRAANLYLAIFEKTRRAEYKKKAAECYENAGKATYSPEYFSYALMLYRSMFREDNSKIVSCVTMFNKSIHKTLRRGHGITDFLTDEEFSKQADFLNIKYKTFHYTNKNCDEEFWKNQIKTLFQKNELIYIKLNDKEKTNRAEEYWFELAKATNIAKHWEISAQYSMDAKIYKNAGYRWCKAANRSDNVSEKLIFFKNAFNSYNLCEKLTVAMADGLNKIASDIKSLYAWKITASFYEKLIDKNDFQNHEEKQKLYETIGYCWNQAANLSITNENKINFYIKSAKNYNLTQKKERAAYCYKEAAFLAERSEDKYTYYENALCCYNNSQQTKLDFSKQINFCETMMEKLKGKGNWKKKHSGDDRIYCRNKYSANSRPY